MRLDYKISKIKINSIPITQIIIDSHVDKHSDHINDEFIMDIVLTLDGHWFFPEDFKNGFYYLESKLKSFNRWYKLVWLLEENKNYIGVITIYRDRRINNGIPDRR